MLEKDNKALNGAFENIPNSLYYTAIFLSGEWGQVLSRGMLLCARSCACGDRQTQTQTQT